MAPVLTIADLREMHRRHTPKMFYDYADSGSYTEGTYRENETAFSAIKLRQRVARNIDNRSVAATILGKPATMPVYLAPVGMTGMQWADGEIHAARAAEKFGVPYTLSTMSICSLEDVAAATSKPFWFQLYVMRDRGFAADLIARAKAVGCSALVLTLDLQILGQRHKDLRNGLSAPPKMTPQVIADLMRHPVLVHEDAGHQAPPVRQHRRPREGGERHVVPVRMDRLAVRPDARLVVDRLGRASTGTAR